MKLSDVVAQHGYQLSELGEIEKARLYERRNADGALELLCVQKIGNVFRVDRQALAELVQTGCYTDSDPMIQELDRQIASTQAKLNTFV